MTKSTVVIVGAGAAGLACAARLQEKGIESIVLEASENVAQKWRSHYDRLHLHTNRSNSTLPGMDYPKGTPKYPSRQQVVDYMDSYARTKHLDVRFKQRVNAIEKSENQWITTTDTDTYESEYVIVCTGKANHPRKVEKQGQGSFTGQIIHSADYKNGKPFEGKHVLVVGFGNSACEIAICLHEHGALPALSVRGAVNVVPRDILGIPVLQIGIVQGTLPPKVTDTLNKPLLRLLVGDIEKYGLRKLPYGPREQIINHGRIPLLDIGTMDLIKKGKIGVFQDIERIKGSTVYFDDGKSQDFEAIVMATGYLDGLEKIVKIDPSRLEDARKSVLKREKLGADGIYFCGFFISPTGMLREIKIESKAITDHLVNQLK